MAMSMAEEYVPGAGLRTGAATVSSGGSGASAAQPTRNKSGTKDHIATRRDFGIKFPLYDYFIPFIAAVKILFDHLPEDRPEKTAPAARLIQGRDSTTVAL
jgi:hypothetical protein